MINTQNQNHWDIEAEDFEEIFTIYLCKEPG